MLLWQIFMANFYGKFLWQIFMELFLYNKSIYTFKEYIIYIIYYNNYINL